MKQRDMGVKHGGVCYKEKFVRTKKANGLQRHTTDKENGDRTRRRRRQDGKQRETRLKG